MIVTHRCGLTSASVFLAELLERPAANIREQLRQWYNGAWRKGERSRSEINVSESFAPLLQWILRRWSPGEKNLVLAADASTLGQRFTILVISVVYRGCSIPVAWKVLKANEPGSWQPHWLALLTSLKGAIPEDWFVLVTTDRGLYAKWFYEEIQALHWHPFMRINHTQGLYQRHKQSPFEALKHLITEVGQQWAGEVICFKNEPLTCTLLARWDEGYSDPWLVVTDLSPHQADVAWYGMRSWIECLFKDMKRGGLDWHQTKMKDPERAERLWLAMAVATLWLVQVGGQADAQMAQDSLLSSTPTLPSEVETEARPLEQNESSSIMTQPSRQNASVQRETKRHPRWLSCFRHGFLITLAALVKGDPLPTGRFVPDFAPFLSG